MARLPRASFVLLLSPLAASGAVIGFLVLHQVPTIAESLGIGPVIGGVVLHSVVERADDARRRHVRMRYV